MPTSTYDLIASNVLSSSASSVTFSSIPATYRDLVLVCDITGNSASSSVADIQVNNDTGSNYSRVRMVGTGSTTSSAASTGTAFESYNGATDTTRMLYIVQIMDYSATDKHKSFLFRDNRADSSVVAIAGRWANTNAIDTVKVFTGNAYGATSSFYLYGIVS